MVLLDWTMVATSEESACSWYFTEQIMMGWVALDHYLCDLDIHGQTSQFFIRTLQRQERIAKIDTRSSGALSRSLMRRIMTLVLT
jgi:hypothetical protein